MRHVGCAALALASAVTTAAAQSAAPPEPPPDAKSAAWVTAVRAHVPGEVDNPVLTIAGWPRADLAAVLPPVGRTPTDSAFLVQAVTLHTDIAIAQRAAYEQRLPVGLVGKTLLLDPKDRGAVQRGYQWQVARVVAGALAADARGAAMARLWYQAIGVMLQQWGDFVTLRPHLKAGLERFPDDAELLLLAGTMHLGLADVRVQRYVEASSDNVARRLFTDSGSDASQARRARTQIADRLGIEGAGHELDRSERALRLALERDPRLVEARVRLAHVLHRRDRHQHAVDLLAAIAPATLPPRLEYYEAMILGASLDRLGRRREALAAFERAAALLPGAQSARIALSRQALIDGHPIDGLGSMLDAIGPEALARGRAAGDPWLAYFRFHEPDAKTLLTTFRETVP